MASGDLSLIKMCNCASIHMALLQVYMEIWTPHYILIHIIVLSLLVTEMQLILNLHQVVLFLLKVHLSQLLLDLHQVVLFFLRVQTCICQLLLLHLHQVVLFLFKSSCMSTSKSSSGGGVFLLKGHSCKDFALYIIICNVWFRIINKYCCFNMCSIEKLDGAD